FFFFQAEDGIRDFHVTGVQTCALPIYDRLQAELNELIANRPVLAAEINARREEGDLRENGGYHAAREEQGKQEARIRYLEELLRDRKSVVEGKREEARRSRRGDARQRR